MAGRKTIIQLEYNSNVESLLKEIEDMRTSTNSPELVYVKLHSNKFPMREFDLPSKLRKLFLTYPMVKPLWDDSKISLDQMSCTIGDSVENEFNLNLSSDVDDIFRQIEEVRSRLDIKLDTYIVMGQLNSKENEAIDSREFFDFLQRNNIPSVYVMWKEHHCYKQMVLKYQYNVIGLEGDGCSNDEIVRVLANKLVRCKWFVQENCAMFLPLRKWLKKSQTQFMFLQHGTFYTEIEKSIAWLFQQYDKINVASRKEAQFIAQILPKSFLQRRDPFLIGGLPRWDRLVDAKDISLEKKYILFMPTWRDYIDSQSVLESSMYYRKIKEFCSSEYVEYLRAQNVELVFAPHHHLINKCGLKFDLPCIQASPNTISTWIKKASMLVTDISSVSIDFVFQDKPIIFWVFDRKDKVLSKSHDNGGKILAGFNNLSKNYPNVIDDLSDVKTAIDGYIDTDFKLEDEKRDKFSGLIQNKSNVC